MTTYYTAGTVLGDEILVNKIKSLLHSVNTLEGLEGVHGMQTRNTMNETGMSSHDPEI